jgi:hypothetical protein
VAVIRSHLALTARSGTKSLSTTRISRRPEQCTYSNYQTCPAQIRCSIFHSFATGCAKAIKVKSRTAYLVVRGQAMVYECNYRKGDNINCISSEFKDAWKGADEKCGKDSAARVRIRWWTYPSGGDSWVEKKDHAHGRGVKGSTICGWGMKGTSR